MTPKEKATEIANGMVRKSIFDMDDEELKIERKYAKGSAIYCVNQIIKGIEATIKHCDLNNNDLQDVTLDIEFWDKVVMEIKKL